MMLQKKGTEPVLPISLPIWLFVIEPDIAETGKMCAVKRPGAKQSSRLPCLNERDMGVPPVPSAQCDIGDVSRITGAKSLARNAPRKKQYRFHGKTLPSVSLTPPRTALAALAMLICHNSSWYFVRSLAPSPFSTPFSRWPYFL